MRKIILIISIVLLSGVTYGATYHVATTGSDSTGDGSLGNPWLTPVYGVNHALNVAGNTLYIHSGTYDISTAGVGRSGALRPTASNCTLAAYPGDTVTLRGSPDADFANGITGGLLCTYSSISGFTVDGLIIVGMFYIWSDDTTIQNCEFTHGTEDGGDEQGALIFTGGSGGTDFTDNLTIKNCKLHDNVGTPSQPYANNALIMGYGLRNLVVENCEFYNSYGPGITLKDDLDNATIRYNYFHDNANSAIWTGNNTADAFSVSANIYQNIFANNNTGSHEQCGGITFASQTSLVNVYNNTFYRNYLADVNQYAAGSSVPFAFFNNISYSPRTYHLTWPYGSSIFDAHYLDYNDYYNDVAWYYLGNTDSTLSAWVTRVNALLTGADSHSVTTDPGFLNASGNFNTPSDFKRSSYSNITGRGGSYSTVVGAYITGSETIGYTSGGDSTPAPPTLSGVSATGVDF